MLEHWMRYEVLAAEDRLRRELAERRLRLGRAAFVPSPAPAGPRRKTVGGLMRTLVPMRNAR